MKIRLLLEIDGRLYELKKDNVNLTIHDEEKTMLSICDERDEIEFEITDKVNE